MTPPDDAELADWRRRLRLAPDGAAFATRSSWLQPVRTAAGDPAMLKLSRVDDERAGAAVMIAWAGRGAARVLSGDGDALVLERLAARPALSDLDDPTALPAICGVVGALHAAVGDRNGVHDLARRFRSLERAAGQGAPFARAWSVAQSLLASQREPRLLHGDMHHENVLWGGASRGWLAIDPQPLWGERTYDYANLLKNPMQRPDLMLAPGRLGAAATLISDAAGLSRDRLLAFAFAHAALSAAWSLEDGLDPTLTLAVAEIAEREHDRSGRTPGSV